MSSVVNFGAFVDLGGMDGLVHVSELSWKHVDHPGSVVAVGDEITVQVLEVDLDRERISLSLKATQQDPWQEFASGHRVGELVYGRVTKLVPFGAFVQVGDGIEGLVHISEMSAHHVDLPEQVVTPGEELWVKIIDLDLQRRRISLSIKQAAEGGIVASEYQEHFGEHAYDDEGNYIGSSDTGAEEAWAEYYAEAGLEVPGAERAAEDGAAPPAEVAEAADAARRGRRRGRSEPTADGRAVAPMPRRPPRPRRPPEADDRAGRPLRGAGRGVVRHAPSNFRRLAPPVWRGEVRFRRKPWMRGRRGRQKDRCRPPPTGCGSGSQKGPPRELSPDAHPRRRQSSSALWPRSSSMAT